MVQVKLSQYYDYVHTAVYYCAVQLYLHALSATSLEGDVQLTSTSEWLSQQKGPEVGGEFEAW
jgi:hypothetical protein